MIETESRMKVTRIIFSPTGGTERVLDAMLQGKKIIENKVDLLEKDIEFDKVWIDEDSLVFIAVPSYSGRAPEVSMERLAKIKGNHAKCVLVVSYGNREYEDTLVEMYDVAVACGFTPIAAVAGIAEHSVDREIAKGRPDSTDVEVLKQFGDKVIAGMNSAEQLKQLPGNRPYKGAPTGSNCPQASDACVKCGICKHKCPVDAIDDEMKGNPDKCASCMRCIAVCPVAARALDAATTERIHNYLYTNCRVRKEPELFLN